MKNSRLATLLLILISNGAFADSPSFPGHWTSNCFKLPLRHRLKNSLEISDTTVELESTLFAESDQCGTENWVMRFKASYETGPLAGSGYEFNYVPVLTTLTLVRQEIVDLYNLEPKKKGCGLTDWKLNEPRDVSGRVCDGNQVPVNGQMLFDIYGVTGTILRFSTFTVSPSPSSAAGRPAVLNAGMIFTQP